MRVSPNAILCFFVVAASVMDSAAQRHQIAVTAESTPQQQLTLARKLSARVTSQSTVPERELAAGIAAAHYQVVLQKWPSDQDSVLQAYLGQHRAFELASLPINSEAVLLEAAERGKKTARSTEIFLELGIIQRRLGKNPNAEKSFDVAATPENLRRAPVGLQVRTLNVIATYYEKKKDTLQASKYLRQAAALPTLSNLQIAGFLLRSLKQTSDSKERAQRQKDLEDLDRVITAAERESMSNAASIELRNMLRREYQRQKKISE